MQYRANGNAWRRVLFQMLFLVGAVAILSVGLRLFVTPWPFYVVISGSMVPTLKVGDMLVVRDSGSFYSVEKGDIIVFNSPFEKDRVIVHRVFDVVKEEEGGKTYFTTKGDNSLARDPWRVSSSDYIGKVIFAVPYLGYLLTSLSPPVNYILIALILVIIFLVEVAKAGRRK